VSRLIATSTVIALLGLTLLLGGLAFAEDPILDPNEPPVRLKKKVKPPKDGDKDKNPADKDKKPMKEPEKDKKPADKEEPLKPADKDKAPLTKKNQAEEERKKLVKRVLKNLESAEKQLVKNDPGRTTQEIQRDILKDLDKLINEAKQQQASSKSSSSSSSSSSRSRSRSRSKSSSSKSNSSSNSQSSQQPRGGKQPKDGQNSNQRPMGGSKDMQKQNNPMGGAKDKQKQKKPMGSKDKQKQKKPAGSKDKKDKEKSRNPKATDPNDAGTGKGGKAKKRNNLADVFKNPWGHYLEIPTPDMDAFADIKFLPDFDLYLRQYYRTLAEENRRK
jgi:hypothetical protein